MPALPALLRHCTLLVDFLIILTCLWLGKGIALLLPFSFPGSIIGMLLLFLLLNFQLVKLSAVERGATLLLRHMALLFIPVAVGLIAYLEPFTQSLGVIMLNVLLGIALILLVVGQLFQRLNR